MRIAARNESGLLLRPPDTPSSGSDAVAPKRRVESPSFHAGWYDCPLSEKGHEEATEAGRLVAAEGFKFDVAFTSTLKKSSSERWTTPWRRRTTCGFPSRSLAAQ